MRQKGFCASSDFHCGGRHIHNIRPTLAPSAFGMVLIDYAHSTIYGALTPCFELFIGNVAEGVHEFDHRKPKLRTCLDGLVDNPALVGSKKEPVI